MRTIIPFLICTLIGTACSFQKKVSNSNTDTLSSIIIVEENDDDLLYINSVKGKIRVRYSNMEANLSSCNSDPIKDTVINTIIIPIEE